VALKELAELGVGSRTTGVLAQHEPIRLGVRDGMTFDVCVPLLKRYVGRQHLAIHASILRCRTTATSGDEEAATARDRRLLPPLAGADACRGDDDPLLVRRFATAAA
jgi:hypothetical protein